MRWLLITAFLALGGCGATPYADLGLGVQIDGNTSRVLRTNMEWQCDDNLQGRLAMGLDWGHWELEYQHMSWAFCGRPFGDSRPELFADSIFINYRFGGK